MRSPSRRPKLRCRIEPVQDPIIVGESLSYVIVNEGDAPLMYGFDDSLARKTKRGWQLLPFGGWVAAIGMIVEANQRSEPKPVEVTRHLGPGRYRLTKKVSRGYEPEPDSITARCEFDVMLFREE